MDEEKFLKKFASILGDGAKEELEKIEQKKLKENKLLESFSKSLSKIADFEVRLEEEVEKPKEVKLPSNYIKKPEKIVPPPITMEEPKIEAPKIEEEVPPQEILPTVEAVLEANIVASATSFTSKVESGKKVESEEQALLKKEIELIKKSIADVQRLIQRQSQKSIIVQSGAGGGGEVNLKKLDDVDYTSLKSAVDGQVLTFNADTGKWQASDPTGGGGQGTRGYTGSQGYTGSAGSVGYTGSAGINGYTGSFGSVGFTGSIGTSGFTGSSGSDGYTGSAGTIGYTGSIGNTGFTGSIGALGYTGSQGEQGSIGYTGSLGYAGSVGYIGSVGYTGSAGASVTPSLTPPTSPSYGDLWFSPNTGILSFYYEPESVWLAIGDGAQGYTGSSGFDPSNQYTFSNTVTFKQTTQSLNVISNAVNTVEHNYSNSLVFYHTAMSNNFTANFINLPTTDQRIITVTLFLDQGIYGYYANSIQIAGVNQTIKWLSNTYPVAQNYVLEKQLIEFIRVNGAWLVTSELKSYS